MLRPRMSRIFYKGKFYDYPLKAMNALRNLGLWEAVLCGFSYLWARIRPPKDESNYENWLVDPLRLAPLPHLLQDLHREGVGRAGRRHAGRLGGPAGQEPRPAQGGPQRHPAQAQPDGDHHPHRGVPVPQVRPRDDVGGLRGEGAGRRGDGGDGAAADRHQRRPAGRAVVGHLHARTGREHTRAGLARDLDHADARAGAHHHAAPAARGGRRRPTTCTTATTSPSRSSCPSRAASPTTGSTSTPPTSRSGASRTTARGRPTWSRTGAPASASSTSSSRATPCGTCPTRSSIALGTRELVALGLAAAGDVERGYVVRVPKAYPYYDFSLQGQRRHDPQVARGRGAQHPPGRAATACTSTTTRTTPCTPPC